MQTPEEPAATVTLQISMDERSDSEVPAVRVTLQVNEVKRSEEPAGRAEPQVCEEEALGAATGSPVAAAPATEDLQPQQSELNANSSSSDKCSLADTLDQPGETEVSVTPICVLIHSELAAIASSILTTIMVIATVSAL